VVCDEANISTTDFSICIKHVPHNVPNVDYDDELKKLFENHSIPGEKIVVKKVNLAFNL